MNQSLRASAQFSAVPIHLSEGLTITRVVIGGAPWQPPPLQGMIGTRAGKPEEDVLILTHETPLALLSNILPMDKIQLERLHMDKFCTDWAMAKGERPYRRLTIGPDPNKPPDFAGESSDGTIGIDCVQFAVERRRVANGQFDALKRTVAEANPAELSHLGGLLLYVWVPTEGNEPELPLRRDAHQELVQALKNFRFEPGTGRVPAGEMPAKAPDLGMTNTDSGWKFYATPLMLSAPVTPFFVRMGFEMAFIFASEHTAASAWEDLGRRVTQHDQSEIDELVVTVGGPDRSGNIHPAEEAILDLMLPDVAVGTIPSPSHLQRVFLHGWATGRIVQVIPSIEPVAEGRFQGIVASHQPLIG